MADDNINGSGAEPEHTGEVQPPKRRRVNIAVGALCVLLIAACIFYVWHKNKAPQQAQDMPSAVAVVNVDKLIAEHPGYAKLQALEAEKMVIASQLKSYALEAKSLRAAQELTPAADVFNEVVDQQDNLRNIQSLQQLREETAAKENELRNSIADERNAAIKEINDRYYNEILNCTIKLDNAKNLRLTKAEQEGLLNQLEDLKHQRGKAVFELEQQFNLRIAKDLMQWRAQREQELGIANAAEHQRDEADSAARQLAEQQRDAQYAQDRLKMMNARRQDSVRLLVLLHTKDNEIRLLKKSILRDIAGKAAKVAIQKHLKLVITNGQLNKDSFGSGSSMPFEGITFGGMVVAADAEDITEDIRAEMQADRDKSDRNATGGGKAPQQESAE